MVCYRNSATIVILPDATNSTLHAYFKVIAVLTFEVYSICFVDIGQYLSAFRIGRFANSVLICWKNRTTLPPGIIEASMIFRVSRNNWTSYFTAPILQYYANIDNLDSGQYYKIQFSVGPTGSGAISSTLRPFAVSLVNTLSQRKFFEVFL